MRSQVVLVGWVALIPLLAGTGNLAFANGPATTNPAATQANSAAVFSEESSLAPTMPWNDSDPSSGYQQCGQTCLIKKANENLTLQANYIRFRVTDILGMYDQAQPDYQGIRTQLGADYCPDQSGASDADAAKECVRRFLETEMRVTQSIGNAIAHNLRIVPGYRADIAGIDSKGNVTTRRVGPYQVSSGMPPAKLPQTPYAPLAKDLQQQMTQQRMMNQNYAASQSYADWIAKNKPVKPNPSDFYIWKTTTIPSGENVSVPVYDSQGKPQIDQVALKRANDVYNDQYADYLALSKLKSAPGPVIQPVSNKDEAWTDYGKAYDDYVTQSNASLQRGVAVIQAGRKPANSSGYGPTSSTQIQGVPGAGPVVPAATQPSKEYQDDTLTMTPEFVNNLLDDYQKALKNL